MPSRPGWSAWLSRPTAEAALLADIAEEIAMPRPAAGRDLGK
jgi:hypothetical protein